MRVPFAGTWVVVDYVCVTTDHPVWEGEKYHDIEITKAHWLGFVDDLVDLADVINQGTVGEHLIDKIWEHEDERARRTN